MAAALGSRGEQRWATIGVSVIQPAQGFQVLGDLLRSGSAQASVTQASVTQARPAQARPAQVGVMAIAWPQFLQHFPTQAAVLSELVSGLVAEERSPSPVKAEIPDLWEQVTAALPAQQKAVLAAGIQQEVATALGLPPCQTLDPQKGFFEMGMDSLMSLDLKNRLQTRLGQPLSSTLIFDYPTVDVLAQHLLNQVLGLGPSSESLSLLDTAQPQPLLRQASDSLAAIQQLSDAELTALIDRELNTLVAGHSS
ncbi:MAG: acyl carrier protein [Leptolyngbyaceae cyanobacterium CRU_2_3]|nr:acyl carrier protein [Leptolyngbyaceae cyanobacterium CRU_2_3]